MCRSDKSNPTLCFYSGTTASGLGSATRLRCGLLLHSAGDHLQRLLSTDRRMHLRGSAPLKRCCSSDFHGNSDIDARVLYEYDKYTDTGIGYGFGYNYWFPNVQHTGRGRSGGAMHR